MDEEIKELLDERIREGLNNLTFDEEGATEAVKNLEILYKLRIEEEKIEFNADDQYNRRVLEESKNNKELQIKEKQQKIDTINSAVKLGVGLLELTVPLVVYSHFVKMGFKFEETGAFTSKTFMDLFRKISPKN